MFVYLTPVAATDSAPLSSVTTPDGCGFGGGPGDLQVRLEAAGHIGDRAREPLDDAQVHRAAVDGEVDPRGAAHQVRCC